jgi:hypothetical protein
MIAPPSQMPANMTGHPAPKAPATPAIAAAPL